MPMRPVRAVLLVAGALLLTACARTAAAPPPAEGRPGPVDPAGSAPDVDEPLVDVPAGPHEVSLVADLGPLPDAPGRAVVSTTWTTDADGTVRFAIDTPAGLADQHVFTDDEHWWWLHPEVRRTTVDAAWIHFDLHAVAQAGRELPDVVRDARQPPPQPHEVAVGDVVAGREVLAVEVVGADDVRLTVAGIEQPVVLTRRALPRGITVDVPSGAVDVGDLPEVLRW